jgi:hypothetical protein
LLEWKRKSDLPEVFMKGQKRSQRRGERMGIYDRFLHMLHHLDIARSGHWPSPERIDEVLREDREKEAEAETPQVRGEREI